MVKKVDRPRDVMDTWCPCTESIVGIKKDKISVEFATIVFFEFIQGVDGNVCLLMCLHDCVFSNVIIPYSMNANKTNDS